MQAPLRFPYLLVAALSGALFGAGLYTSQMVDPMKVLRFLDFTAIPQGGWDPSLALVMLAAVCVMAIAVRLGRGRPAPFFDARFYEPASTTIDTPLLAGAALFGVGWGMTGLCPGPAISLAAFWPEHLPAFLLALLAGSYAGSWVMPSATARPTAAAP
jgi:uncharacterized membrane protein YedE/YeeE